MNNLSVFFLITILVLLFVNPVLACDTCHSIIHHEKEPGLEVYNAFTFENVMVVQLVKPLTKNLCLEPRIELRLVHQNRAVEALIVDYLIPEYNFCLGLSGYYSFGVRQLSDYILINYVIPNITSASFNVLLVDKTGKVIRF